MSVLWGYTSFSGVEWKSIFFCSGLNSTLCGHDVDSAIEIGYENNPTSMYHICMVYSLQTDYIVVGSLTKQKKIDF